MRLRAPTLDDLPQLVELFAALQEQGIGGASEAELRDWFESPMHDPAEDFRVAVAGGRLVGWCDVWDRERQRRCFWLDVRAHPPAADVYAALLAWGTGRAAARSRRGHAVSRVIADADDVLLATAAAGSGYVIVRHAYWMEIDLTEEPPAPGWPEGVTVRAFRPEDERAVYEAEREIFAGDWNFTALDFDDWGTLHTGSAEFDPEVWFLAEAGRELTGIALCRAERRPGAGHVSTLGVREAWRGRGLGTALLLHAFRELRLRGRARADLGVDTANAAGALRLYERAGMHAVRRWDTYERELGL